jgi:ketosteroid isomerase-like protein
MFKSASLIIFLILNLFTSSVFALENTKTITNDKIVFEELFNRWTEAFNHQDLDGSCALFAKSVKAKYRGVSEKDYTAICNGFAKVFNEKDKSYSYSFDLHDIYWNGNLAVARITWYLQIKENGRNKSIIQDEGMDVLEKNEQGEWKIVNYLAFSE